MNLIDLLIKHESLRLMVYDDATGKPIKAGDTLVGNPTIGIGRELSKTGISDDEARYLAKNDIVRFSEGLDKSLPWWRQLSDNRQQVLFSMAFNMGIDGLLGFKNMLSACKSGNYVEAASHMKDSKWYSQVKSRGDDLVKLMIDG